MDPGTDCSAIQAEARRLAVQGRLAQRRRDNGMPRAPRRYPPARLLLAGLCLALLLLGNTAVLVQASGLSASSRIYTVAAIQAGLRHDPAAWVGRTVRVRAVLWGCLTWSRTPETAACMGQQPMLLDTQVTAGSEPLPLAWGGEHSVLALLRALPIVGSLVPAPRAPVWGAAATYRVRIEAGRRAAERERAYGQIPYLMLVCYW